MFCSSCGRAVREFERFCAVCGNKLDGARDTRRTDQSTSEPGSFESLVASRVREARRKKTVIGDESFEEHVEYPDDEYKTIRTVGSEKSVPVSAYVSIKATLATGLTLMILGYFVLPFAYVLNNESGSLRKFEWRLHEIATLLGERTDEEYVFGPALAFMVGGHLWAVLCAVIIVGLVFLVLRDRTADAEGDADRRDERAKFAILIGRTSVVLMALIFTWQLTGMLTLQRAADVQGGLSGEDSLTYFSLGLGSVASLLGIGAFMFAGASLVNRGSLEKADR